MKKINEQTKSFLLYGIEDVIKPKEIYKLDGAILFLVFLFFFLSESAPSPFFSKVFLVIVYLGFVILSFSRTEVTGKKVFWIIGIQSLTAMKMAGLSAWMRLQEKCFPIIRNMS